MFGICPCENSRVTTCDSQVQHNVVHNNEEGDERFFFSTDRLIVAFLSWLTQDNVTNKKMRKAHIGVRRKALHGSSIRVFKKNAHAAQYAERVVRMKSSAREALR